MEIEDLKEKKVYFFKADRWLAVEKNDGRVSCNLTPTLEEELSVRLLFHEKFHENCSTINSLRFLSFCTINSQTLIDSQSFCTIKKKKFPMAILIHIYKSKVF